MKKHLFLHTLVAVALTLFATVDSQAGVSKAAFLQGSQVAGNADYLTSATPISVSFNEYSSIDPSVYEHDSNQATELKILEDGDYLVAATMPIISVETPDNRPCAALEVFVNGSPAPGSLGQSGYIRNQPRNTNMQSETSCHAPSLTGIECWGCDRIEGFQDRSAGYFDSNSDSHSVCGTGGCRPQCLFRTF